MRMHSGFKVGYLGLKWVNSICPLWFQDYGKPMWADYIGTISDASVLKVHRLRKGEIMRVTYSFGSHIGKLTI